MTCVCCSSCLLRFTPADSAYLLVCPGCGRPLAPVTSKREMVGFRLVSPEDLDHALPQALTVSMPDPTTVTDR
jgi:hypothetical protein